jgi:hypothetical protein
VGATPDDGYGCAGREGSGRDLRDQGTEEFLAVLVQACPVS